MVHETREMARRKAPYPYFMLLSITVIIRVITVKIIGALLFEAIVPGRATLLARWGGDRRPTTGARYRQQRAPGVGQVEKREAQAWLPYGEGRRSPAAPPYWLSEVCVSAVVCGRVRL